MIQTVIVDDEILSRIGLRTFLEEEEDITVTGAFSGADEALAFLRERPADIVLTDIEMSGMNGLDFIKTIREEGLAMGVIIVSCHDDFRYAQKAISLGTDSYLLKDSLNQELLTTEIRKVWKKRCAEQGKRERRDLLPERDRFPDNGTYQIAVVDMKALFRESSGDGNSMAEELLDELVRHYHMGTFFTPLNREDFLILTYPGDMDRQRQQALLSEYADILVKNMRQYTNENVMLGVSSPFSDLRKVREKYEEACKACGQSFYGRQKRPYALYEEISGDMDFPVFPAKEASDIRPELFRDFFEEASSRAAECCLPADVFREKMIDSMNNLTQTLMKNHFFRERLLDIWNCRVGYTPIIQGAQSAADMENRLAEAVGAFCRDMKEIGRDYEELKSAYLYIEEHMAEKIQLSDLAACCSMSVPNFCRKFVHSQGETANQYITRRRVDQAKVLLREGGLTLAEIAERTGFSNENYLSRVFKKVTGNTISSFRNA